MVEIAAKCDMAGTRISSSALSQVDFGHEGNDQSNEKTASKGNELPPKSIRDRIRNFRRSIERSQVRWFSLVGPSQVRLFLAFPR